MRNMSRRTPIALLGVELTDDEEQMVYAHLSDCPHCREQFRRDRKAWQAISTCPAVTADASFDRMLSLRLSLEEHEPRPEQVDRVLPELETEDVEQDARYDLSRLAISIRERDAAVDPTSSS